MSDIIGFQLTAHLEGRRAVDSSALNIANAGRGVDVPTHDQNMPDRIGQTAYLEAQCAAVGGALSGADAGCGVDMLTDNQKMSERSSTVSDSTPRRIECGCRQCYVHRSLGL